MSSSSCSTGAGSWYEGYAARDTWYVVRGAWYVGRVRNMSPLERLTRLKRLITDSDVWPMLKKELLQLRRDRLTFAMMTGIPAIQLLLFGFAIQTEVRHLPTVVLDESQSQQSRGLIDRMVNTGNFDLVGTVADREAL